MPAKVETGEPLLPHSYGECDILLTPLMDRGASKRKGKRAVPKPSDFHFEELESKVKEALSRFAPPSPKSAPEEELMSIEHLRNRSIAAVGNVFPEYVLDVEKHGDDSLRVRVLHTAREISKLVMDSTLSKIVSFAVETLGKVTELKGSVTVSVGASSSEVIKPEPASIPTDMSMGHHVSLPG